jgi:hypothetical protein
MTIEAFYVIAGIASIVGIALAVYFYYRTRQIKELSYSIITATPLLQIGSEIAGRVQILLDAKPIEDVNLLIVAITNTGNVPIATPDYEHPVTMTFGEDIQIIEADITAKEPENLPSAIEYDQTIVTIKPTLLNSRDSLTIKMLLSGKPDFAMTGRIVGIKQIKNKPHIESDANLYVSWASRISSITAVLVLVLAFAAVMAAALAEYAVPMYIFAMILLIIIMVSVVFSYWESLLKLIKRWS